MAQLLGDVAVGTIVKINENGAPVNYIVVNQGIPGNGPLYDQSCDGTWVLRQDIIAQGPWNSSGVNTLPNSTIMQAMAGYLSLYDPGIQASIKTVKIPYCVGNGSSTVNSGANGLECQVFPLSGYELGWTTSNNLNFPEDGSRLDYFISGEGAEANNKRVSTFGGSAEFWFTRTAQKSGTNACYVINDGTPIFNRVTGSFGYRPAFILPQNLTVLPDGTLQAAPSFNTLPIQVMEGQSLPITWSAMDGATAYTLQRKADSGEWTTVYTGATASYTDTVPTGSTLQYQVSATIDGAAGAYGQSGVITVISASALAISGQDGDLGTITNDITYAVSTDTGNQIALTRTVNGALVASLTVDSGFSYNIPVMDLPTGTGTIVITATVQTSSDPVTVTRTWTYTKAAQTFPSSGGVAQLTQDGQNVFPLTLAEAIKTIGGPWGGNLSTALNKLALAAVYNRTSTPKYTEAKVDLSKAKAGDIVNLPENGVMVPFYVASLNYEPALNTSGTRVLLVRKSAFDIGQWNASGINAYVDSTIDTWFNSAYLPMLDSTVQAQVGTTTFQYTPGNGNNTVTTLARAVFALSFTELGFSDSSANAEGSISPIASLLKIARLNGKAVMQWTRTPYTNNTSLAFIISEFGDLNNGTNYVTSNNVGYRPCFTLPATFQATYYVDQNGTVHPEQEYTTAGDFADLWGNIIPTVKIETGSYTGTGTYGSGDPNMLVLQERPKLIFISDFGSFTQMVYMDNQREQTRFSPNGIVFYLSGTPTILKMYVFMSENKFQWYSDSNASNQLNQSGHEYSYTAIY